MPCLSGVGHFFMLMPTIPLAQEIERNHRCRTPMSTIPLAQVLEKALC